MLKISTKTRYALRALLEMACRNDKQRFTLRELAAHQNISRKYLENIFAILRKHHIVKSDKGKNGGFYFAANLKDISVLRIMEALEGKLDLVNCRHSGRMCTRISFCPTRNIWQELNKILKDDLISRNLKDLSSQKDILDKWSYLLSRSRNL